MKLLIIGHLEGHISDAGKIALSRGAKVMHSTTIEQGLIALRNGDGIELVMIDVKEDVKQFIDQLKLERIAIPVVACGIGNDKQSVIRAIKSGAKEYVPLPPDAELIAAVLAAVTQEDRSMIADDPAMIPVMKMAKQIAPSTATVLITGESGTGKEVMARFIHENSPRVNGRFISVNCAAIPENLLESELFGHEKGAFTGAVARRIGKFEEADGGTLLLDEVSEMHPLLQAKLLRAIQEKEIDRLGGGKPVKVDIRLLATSNRDLQREVMAGNFREDLYFRLNVVNLLLPPLRERRQDLAKLTTFFVQKYAGQNDMPVKQVSEGAMHKIFNHVWRGNIRELENTMHRAVLISTEDHIEPEAIILAGQAPIPATPAQAPTQQISPANPYGSPPSSSGVLGNSSGLDNPTPQAAQAVPVAAGNPYSADSLTPFGDDEVAGTSTPATVETAPNESAPDTATSALVGRTVAHVERDLIIDTLDHCLGNRTHAANILGISIRTLRNKLRQYNDDGLEIPEAHQSKAK